MATTKITFDCDVELADGYRLVKELDSTNVEKYISQYDLNLVREEVLSCLN